MFKIIHESTGVQVGSFAIDEDSFSGWKPMKDAPKDHTSILVKFSPTTFLLCFYDMHILNCYTPLGWMVVKEGKAECWTHLPKSAISIIQPE